MLLRLFLPVLLLVSFNLGAMDAKDRTTIKGVTIIEAARLLRNRSENLKWKASKVCSCLGITALSSFLVPGLAPGFPLSLAGCTDNIAGGQCIAGLTCVSLVPLLGLATACSVPIAWAQNHYTDYLNKRSRRLIDLNFIRCRDLNQGLSEEDMQEIGFILMEEPDLLKKLSPTQALILAGLNPSLFAQQLAQNKFSIETEELANKLLPMLKLEANDLAQELKSKEVKDLFRSEPALWQALVRMMPDQTFNDWEVQKALESLLKALFDDQGMGYEGEWADIIKKVSRGASLSAYLLQEIFVEDELSLY
jgi:hypothetical protein